MKLAELLNLEEGSLSDIDVKGITANSKDVQAGFVFFALKGVKTDGTAYINDAVARGAVGVVSDHLGAIDTNVPVIKVDDAHHALAIAAARFFNKQPAIIAAVTGTSGKTSVVSFLRQIWAHNHLQAASIGTVGVSAPGIHHYGSLTTPDPISLMKVLKELSDHGVTHAAMEASSHGIDQKRLDGVKLSAAAFTNLGRDHMDYHSSVEEYFHAKMRLFDTLLPIGAPAIVYADDAYSLKAIEHIKSHGRDVLTVGQNGDFIKILKITRERAVQHIVLQFNGGDYAVNLPLAGDFQVANSIVAAGLALVTGVEANVAFEALSLLKGAPGRLEQIGEGVDGALVYVDYAHKPDALENVLHSVRPFTKGKVVLVFGCGGDRDKGKRPLMGEIASRLADTIIVTDDNPRSEDPAQIRNEILAAVPTAIEIGDRREAIHYAVNHLEQGDTLIIAGKGHEEGQIIGNNTIPFSDHREAETAIEQRKKNGNK